MLSISHAVVPSTHLNGPVTNTTIFVAFLDGSLLFVASKNTEVLVECYWYILYSLWDVLKHLKDTNIEVLTIFNNQT